ncbi:lipase 1-like [Chelonus insularis]|uniref:lipase 1-like n=1 Tax=Chelonus insularis TaxID=460826 RepID=UPI00158A4E8B|nr:lipase 1-like [Chelonus insularis]
MITIQISIFIFINTFCSMHGAFRDFFLDDYWSAENIVKRDGYRLEVHNVTTEDGYILTVHRIPGGKGAQPILLMHGLLCNSALWLVSGREQSLVYVLADQGYDVWLGNNRGNNYGLNHINLTTDDTEFWDFSFYEMAIYDLPAMINHIQNLTNQHPFYIGHSQGTTIFFLLAILQPDIASLLKQPISLAPVAYVGGGESSLQLSVVSIMTTIFEVTQFFTNLQTFFTPSWWLPLFFLKLSCAVLSLGNYNCLNAVSSILGDERPELFDQAILPAIITNFPAGTSLKNMYLYTQHVIFHRFNQFDYGATKNWQIYNSSIPPEFDLKKVTQPNVIFVADSDAFVDLPDLNKILQLVPNIVDQYIVNASGFTHLDFMWGITAKQLVYNKILELVS